MPNTPPDTPLVREIKAYLARTGESARALSLKVGPNPTLVRQIMEGRSRNPRGDTLKGLADALGVSIERLTSSGQAGSAAVLSLDDDFFQTNAVPAPDVPPPQPRRVPETAKVPVMGTAEAGDDGFFEINLVEGPVEYIDRPAALADIAQGELFAIRVHGDSMDPVWEAGDEVFIVKSYPLKHRGYVVALIENGKGSHPRAILKQFISRNDNMVHLRQFNPPKEVDLPRKMVKEMWRALHWREIREK